MRQKYNKEDILENGITLFRKKGFHDTGIDDILSTCKIPSGSFYNFFKSKEGFAIAAIDQYVDSYINFMQAFLTDTKLSPIERLKSMYQHQINDLIAGKCNQGCLVGSLSSEVGATNKAISQKAKSSYRLINKTIANAIKEGQASDEIRNDYSANELADYLINSFSGATARMKAGLSKQPLQLFIRTSFDFIAQ